MLNFRQLLWFLLDISLRYKATHNVNSQLFLEVSDNGDPEKGDEAVLAPSWSLKSRRCPKLFLPLL